MPVLWVSTECNYCILVITFMKHVCKDQGRIQDIGKGVHTYKWVGVRYADLIPFFLYIQWKRIFKNGGGGGGGGSNGSTKPLWIRHCKDVVKYEGTRFGGCILLRHASHILKSPMNYKWLPENQPSLIFQPCLYMLLEVIKGKLVSTTCTR